MARIIQLVNFLLNSHPFGKFAIFGVLIAFVIWWNYGEQLDTVVSDGHSPMVGAEMVQASTELTPQDMLETTTESTTQPDRNVLVRDEPATPSIEERTRAIESEAMVAKIEKLVKDFSELENNLAAWNQRVGELATNDIGRKLASQTASICIIEALIQSELVPEDQILVLQKRIRLLEDEIIQVRAFKLSPGLEKLVAETKTLLDKYAAAVAQASLSMNTFEKQSRLATPSPMTLAEAIVKRKEALAIAQANLVADEKRKADEQIAAISREAAAIENQRMMKAAEDKMDAAKQRLANEREAQRLEAEKRQLEIEFKRDWPLIQQYLGKLMASGYTQPQSASFFEQRSTQGPVSLAAIRKTGALSDKVEGLDGAYPRFLHLMVSTSNDRVGPSPYPKFIGGYVPQEFVATVREGYTLLRKYQYLLVEKGLLAP